MLAFASIGAPNAPLVAPVSVATRGAFHNSAIKQLKDSADGWKITGSFCATISATAGAIVGQVKAKRRAKRTVLQAKGVPFDPTNEVGALQPMGYWDPLHLMKQGFKNPEGEWKDEDTFRQYRMAELKHGRISMLAMLGLWTATVTKFWGFEDIPSGMAALNTSLGGAGMGIIFCAAGCLELGWWKQEDFKEPGNYGWDPLGWLQMPSETGEGMIFEYGDDLRNRELNNGRLAMSGIITSLLLEYGGKDTAFQFQVESLPGWFFIAALVLLGSVNGSAFYVADDSAAEVPKYIEMEAARQQKLLAK